MIGQFYFHVAGTEVRLGLQTIKGNFVAQPLTQNILRGKQREMRLFRVLREQGDALSLILNVRAAMSCRGQDM